MSNLVRVVDAPLEFSDEQQKMIRDSYANGASVSEFAVLMEIAKARRLNPLLKQVHFVCRRQKYKEGGQERWKSVWTAQVSIDGMRAIAQRTGLYNGQDEPVFEEANGRIVKCTVRVYRKDWERPAVGVAYWSEYVQDSRFWSAMPHTMLSKCAESQALRKAFPEDMGGIYTPEEMDQAGPAVVMLDEGAEPTAPLAQDAPANSLEQDLRASTLLNQITAADSVGALQEAWLATRDVWGSLDERSQRALVEAKDARKAALQGAA